MLVPEPENCDDVSDNTADCNYAQIGLEIIG
jgi:hypothetical protein